jgi:hypothetical protein
LQVTAQQAIKLAESDVSLEKKKEKEKEKAMTCYGVSFSTRRVEKPLIFMH